MSRSRYEVLVMIHELIECFLCEHKAIPQEVVDDFDKTYEDEGEPGDCKYSPYRDQHCIATGVERILAACLGVCWADYEKETDEISS